MGMSWRSQLPIVALMKHPLLRCAGPICTAALLLAGPALAADLQVYITTPDGKPAPDVVVALFPPGGTVPAFAPPAEPVLVVQKDIRFQPYVTAVPLGTTLRFVNRDRFDHHVRSVAGGPLGSIAAAKDIDLRLAALKGGRETSADVKMDAPGITGLGCHLHGSMRAHVFVSPTPWVAVTDAAGKAALPGVPDGAGNLRLWHPDQLVAQPDVRTQAAGSTSVEARLNFSPKTRPAPTRTMRDYE